VSPRRCSNQEVQSHDHDRSTEQGVRLEGGRHALQQAVYATAEHFWSPAYIQHSALVAPGREGLFEFVKAAPELHYENALIVADGNYVMLNSRLSGIGQSVNWVVVDIVRIENGLIAEHWDVIQDEATREPKSGLPMFGDKFPA
jgi:predicted SnoaL-like aldol condensation-catalyzing enzyme